MSHRCLSAAVLALVFSACQARPPPAAAAPPPAAPAVDPALAAQRALDGMDTRKPVPLLPMMAHHQKQNMRDHLLAVQEVLLATAAGDFAAVEKSAARLGSSPQMAQMCTHMGAGAPGFTEQALRFHQVADGLIPAAQKKDSKAVLEVLGQAIATCTACHEAWKQQVVDQEAWTAATRQAAPSDAQMLHHGQ